jgi:hypothetical protein
LGDSHSTFGWNNNIEKNCIGSVLCYSFGKKNKKKKKLSRCDIRNFNIKHGDGLIFCFGKIDCKIKIS